MCEQVMIGFDFTFDWFGNWCKLFLANQRAKTNTIKNLKLKKFQNSIENCSKTNSGQDHTSLLERFSNECHKIKMKVITLTNHNRNKETK